MSPAAGGRRLTTGAVAPVYLVRGDDAALVAQATRTLLDELVGDRDATLVVEEHGGGGGEDLDVGVIVDACTTPPFLVDRRVVVVREAGRVNTADVPRLSALFDDPLDTTVLVLVAGGGTVPAPLVKAVNASGQVIETTVRTSQDRKGWLSDHLRSAPVRLDPQAAARLGEHLGDDLGRLAGMLQVLAGAYGEGATVSAAELEPFLGEAGSVPPWDLTDAVDGGKPAVALAALHRMMGSGGRSGPELVAVLHRHFSNMLRLDGADVASGDDAARVLGVKSAFVGKKALAQSRRLGGDQLGQAISLLADADLDVKGRTALPSELVLEILVARLTRLVKSRPSRVGSA